MRTIILIFLFLALPALGQMTAPDAQRKAQDGPATAPPSQESGEPGRASDEGLEPATAPPASAGSSSEGISPEPSPAPESSDEPTLWEKTKKVGSQVIEAGETGLEKASDELSQGVTLREERPYGVLGTYSIIDTWLPNKWGVSAYYAPSSAGAWELEFMKGSISVPFMIDDLGGLSEQKLSLVYRSFSQRNSFNFFYGINYQNFRVHLGSDYLEYISPEYGGSYEVVQVETLGVTWGLGNRWQLDNGFLISVDWFALYLPIASLESQAGYLETNANSSQKEDIREVMDWVDSLPTFSLLKFQLGYSF